jgi:hypothetical protein
MAVEIAVRCRLFNRVHGTQLTVEQYALREIRESKKGEHEVALADKSGLTRSLTVNINRSLRRKI